LHGITHAHRFLTTLIAVLQVARAVDAPGANSSAYCKYDNQGLQAFTSVLFLVRRHVRVSPDVPWRQQFWQV